MKETQRRIKAYKAALPGLKERIAAVAVLLAMSVAMMTSATFAWLTISRAPEVAGVNTTVAANGNLEIALVEGDGTVEPDASKVGDSSAADGQSVFSANLTWGNLVNLSDPKYGLDNLVLRPAQLNTTDLLGSPLYGAIFTPDGRVERLTSNFSYTSWIPPEGVVEGYFGLANQLGVRAVSSTRREVKGFYSQYLGAKDIANSTNTHAGNLFVDITTVERNMEVLAKLMGTHMTAKLNSEDQYKNAEVSDEDLETLIKMYEDFMAAYEAEAEAIAQMMNVQMYAAFGGDKNKYTEYSAADVLKISTTDSNINAKGDYVRVLNVVNPDTNQAKELRIIDLKTFLSDYNMLATDVVTLREIKDKEGNAKWTKDGLSAIVNRLVNVDQCLIRKGSEEFKTVSALLKQFSDSITTAMGYMNKTCDVKITNGILYNFEQRTGTRISVKGLAVSAKMYISTAGLGEQTANIKANITTSAVEPYEFATDYAYSDSLNTGADNDAGSVVAQDTYALAVDLWVRTNVADSVLTLEGNVLTEEIQQEAMGKDANGNSVPLYTLTRREEIPDAEGLFSTISTTYTLYQLELDSEKMFWYTQDGKAFELTAVEEEMLLKQGGTTGADGITYYTFTREETSTDSFSLYQLNGVWYNAEDGSAFTLNEGETPEITGNTTTVENTEVALYSLERSHTQSATYTIFQETDTVAWYDAETFSAFLLDQGEKPARKIETIYNVIGYEGDNRIWNSEDKSYITTNATTQGSGSCYVYYAENPEDQARSLELLKAMQVAFIDGEGHLLALAAMDTERFYAQSGRVTVPLVLKSGVSIGENEDGSTIYGITMLEENKATRITALVFLDGTQLGNDNVLASADIQGRLNIQFGNSIPMTPVDNEDLERKELNVSASVNNTSFDYDTHEGEMKTTVTVSVDGDQPSTVTGFFSRMISATQGSREQDMTFTKQADGTWTADYIFDSPGVYILRSVRLDGQDYDLSTTPTVTISGFAIQSLVCPQAGANNHITIMEPSNSGSVELSLKFATDDPSKMPTSVQGRFLRTDGTAVNVNFTYNPTTKLWKGTGTFLSSGDYDFSFLILDGEYTALPEGMGLTASITLGMKVAAYTTSPLSFKYLPSQMKDNEKLLGMQIKILDDNGDEMKGLQGVKLVYRMRGSAVQAMDTDLVWDGAKGYYIGDLKTVESGGPGIWQFSEVTVGDSRLTNITTAPVFTMISPEPPKYNGFTNEGNGYQFKPNGDAKLNARIEYSASAKVFAFITDGNGNEYLVEGTPASNDGNMTTWYFAIPKNSGGVQDGYWTMQELRIWNYYTADGEYIAYEREDGTQDDPMVVDMRSENYTTKVVQTVYVTFAEQSADFGKDANGAITGDFMDSYTISGLKVTIKDFEGPLKDVQSVQLKYTYGGDSVAKGGYSGGNVPEKGTTAFTLAMTSDASGTVFTQSQNQTVQIAGTYSPSFSFMVGTDTLYAENGCVMLNGKVPVFTVFSVAPTVKITEAYYASASSTAASTYTDTAVTVYAREYTKTVTSCGRTYEYDAFNQPYVTLTLSGYGNATGATLEFTESNGATVLLYTAEEGKTSVSSYTWSGSGTCKRWVGLWDERTDNDKRTTAGTLKATTLVLTYGGVSYNVSAPITINNPN